PRSARGRPGRDRGVHRRRRRRPDHPGRPGAAARPAARRARRRGGARRAPGRARPAAAPGGRRPGAAGAATMTRMGEVEWLSDREQRVWRSLLRAQARMETELDRDLRRSSGLTLVEYGILVALSESPGRRMRMRRLAEEVLVSKSRLTHQISRLESAGHVRREPCEDDRRGFWAVLTDRGVDALVNAAPGHVAA